jgi:uncharacterized membrane protein YhaH (DUF805 family)
VPVYPFSAMAGRSVMNALLPSARPRGAFWVGVFMVLAGFVLVTCPLMLGVALVIAQGVQQPTQLALGAIGVSGFFVLVLLLPGVALIFRGRARR